MRSLRESILDVDDNIEQSIFDDPERFKENLLKLNTGRWGTSLFYIREFVEICQLMYDMKLPNNLSDADCDKIAYKFRTILPVDKTDKSARNFVFNVINNILHANKGAFCMNSPAVKEGYSFDDPLNVGHHIDLPHPGMSDAVKAILSLSKRVNTGKIKLPIMDVMLSLRMINKDTDSCNKSIKYSVRLRDSVLRHKQEFSIIWIPRDLDNIYKEMIEIMINEI